MNILIVGNGFDLSHYLPTKYDHFMVAMLAIENWDESKGEMGFDDLFKELYEKEDYFFGYTKAIYKIEEVKISVDEIKNLKNQLKENGWYQYFLDHVKEVKTWIDFETKIEEALNCVTIFFDCIKEVYLKENKLDLIIKTSGYRNNQHDNKFVYLNEKISNALFSIRLFDKKFYRVENDRGALKKVYSQNELEKYDYFIKSEFLKDFKAYNAYNEVDCINFLNQQLEDFIKLFNFYIEDLIKKLTPKNNFKTLKSNDYDLTEIAHIYSFNYTQSYLDFYNLDTKTDFLHGRSGKDQNMVLGISELNDDVLKRIKAYGFTKYHQKLMKGTDYIFLRSNSEYADLFYPRGIGSHHLINVNIWGHSLDISDEDYVQEIFSFNDQSYPNVRVIVFYFNHTAKFSLLANLLHILGKEKVEHWMKQGWLKFEPNPDIAQLNQIQPVELPKST